MKTIHARSHVGEDGMLQLRLPAGVTETDVDVVVVVQPIPSDRPKADMDRQAWEQFVRDTAGSIQDPTFFRHEQGEGWKSEAQRKAWQQFVDETAGAWQGEPFKRADEGQFEK